MNAKAFKVIDAINCEGLDNQFWGLVKDVDDTKAYFGSNEGFYLAGAWAYVYNDPKSDHTHSCLRLSRIWLYGIASDRRYISTSCKRKKPDGSLALGGGASPIVKLPRKPVLYEC